ncbi:conserved hypothetical protein [Solidesulfovibrio fructosivorans JJ]]|uniref:Transmembrane protein n=1 Tax=Solidesulfovibrio fructosivorans JJ] TaxID=596151 RepID=E1JT58_SOLFR|nr:hypothetical protein [Solidesulfovibrio fructosivorans]EFL52318.1 conserved hypothetical protein [Solidesulfovibrio fructosivorans JJ]]
MNESNTPDDVVSCDKGKITFFYEHTRNQIQHEDNLINQRVVWLLQVNGFLFAAYAFTLVAQSNTSCKATTGFTLLVVFSRFILSFVGIILSFMLKRGISAAEKSIDELVKSWDELPPDHKKNCPQICGGGGWGNIRKDGAFPSVLIPLALGLAWILILLSQILLIIK